MLNREQERSGKGVIGLCTESQRESCILSSCKNGPDGICVNILYEEEMERRRRMYTEFTSNLERFALDLEKYGRDELLKTMSFGTGGMRGLMRSGFNGINEVTCNLLGTELSKRYSSVVIGCDGRYNSLNYAMLMKEIFEIGGRKAHLHVEVVTPFLAFLVQRLGVEAGIMITASHNPREYNGFKVYTADGSQIRSPLDKEIEESLKRLEVTEFGNSKRCKEIMEKIRKEDLLLNGKDGLLEPKRNFIEEDELERDRLIYEYNKSMFSKWDAKIIRKIKNAETSVPVVFTGLCGVSGEFVKKALKFYQLDGAMCFIEAECSPNPGFPKLPFPNPELDEAVREARMSGLADIVFSCDPDGDRFGLSEKIDGEWISYNGNEIAAMFMYFFVRNFNPSTLAFVNTFLCDGLMEKISLAHGIEHLRTETGFKNVSRAIGTVKEKNVFAYEDSLGFLFGEGMEKDGIKCAVLMMYLVQQKLPSLILKEMGVYGTATSVNVHIRSENPQELLRIALGRIPNIKTENKRSIVELDGYRIILRVSGTEPILKIYASSESLDKQSLSRAVDGFIGAYIKHQ